jgi:hypothetical protein
MSASSLIISRVGMPPCEDDEDMHTQLDILLFLYEHVRGTESRAAAERFLEAGDVDGASPLMHAATTANSALVEFLREKVGERADSTREEHTPFYTSPNSPCFLAW